MDGSRRDILTVGAEEGSGSTRAGSKAMSGDRKRPSPEELLRRVEAEERHERRGRLKVFLGYAAGVGKSYRMLDEGRRRKQRGQDLVVGAVQPSQDEAAAGLLANLESIPVLPNGSLNVDAIRRRRPSVCLIDGLAYRNAPGSRNEYRWQDVEELLASGISVITTINLQFIAEKQERVEAIRGKRVTDSVPEDFLLRADDIEVVDAPALDPQLAELREIALVLAAEVVDAQLVEYLKRHGIDQTYGAHERILVCITPRSNASLMIGRGRRQADRFHGDLFVVYVEQPGLSETDRVALDQNLETARQVDARIEALQGEDVVEAILRFARRESITQIFVGRSQRSGFWQHIRPNPVERLILESGGIDIRVFPQGDPGKEAIP
jgi:two-component system sensor histidine kinase KdpD